MEEIDASQRVDQSKVDLPVPAECGYAKRVDTDSSGFTEVVEDIVFLW